MISSPAFQAPAPALSISTTTATPITSATVSARRDPRKNEPIIQRNVYISGLPSYMQSHEFRELCQRFGRVEASKLCVEGPSNPTKGYGFVLYYSVESAAACIKELSGSYLNGRCLQARLADSHATPQEIKCHMVQPLPPLPPPFPHAELKAPVSVAFTSSSAPVSCNYYSNGSADNSLHTSTHLNVPHNAVVSVTPQGPMRFSQPTHTISAVQIGAQGSTSTNTMLATVSYANPRDKPTSVALPASAQLLAYHISPVASDAERQVMLLQQPPFETQQQLQPQQQLQTIVFAASPAYFMTSAAAVSGGYATLSSVPIAPVVLTGNPSNSVQFISLTPAHGIYRF